MMAMAVDMSTLPDVAWVRILSYLPLSDRAKVAETCHILNNIFNHPSLWDTMEITLVGDLNRFRNSCSALLMPTRYVSMVERFGNYFQDLTLVFAGFLKSIPDDCKKVIEALALNCRLQSLTLEVGGVVSKADLYTQRPRNVDLGAIAELVRHAFRLQSFSLRSWPIYPGLQSVNILQALRENSKVVGLEKLSLYWISASQGTWVTLNAALPSPEEVLVTVKHFANLRTLCLRSTMLNDAVLLELARKTHTPLQRLGILVTYSPHDAEQEIPEIKSSTWSALRQRSPDITVDVTVVTRVPFVELAGFLKPEIALTSINYMKYSHCGPLDVASITDKFHKTLRKFVDYGEGAEMDDELVAMVTKCKKMDIFIYNGKIRSDTVLSLASARGNAWYTFKVNLDNVVTVTNPVKLDDNCVVLQTESGACVLASMVNHETEEDRERRLGELVDKVARELQQRWIPLGRDSVRQLRGHTLVTTPAVIQAASQNT